MVPERAKPTARSDDELVERVQKGETRFYAELVARYQDAVYGMALRFVRRSAEAEDIAQEAFLRAYRGLGGFKREARFSTWLYRITWNLCADWLRRYGGPRYGAPRGPGPRRISVSMDDAREIADATVDVEGDLVEAEEKRAVQAALDGLDEKYRNVVTLLYYQKLSYEEIAGVLQVPLKTVETRLYRARKQLKARLLKAGVGGTE